MSKYNGIKKSYVEGHSRSKLWRQHKEHWGRIHQELTHGYKGFRYPRWSIHLYLLTPYIPHTRGLDVDESDLWIILPHPESGDGFRWTQELKPSWNQNRSIRKQLSLSADCATCRVSNEICTKWLAKLADENERPHDYEADHSLSPLHLTVHVWVRFEVSIRPDSIKASKQPGTCKKWLVYVQSRHLEFATADNEYSQRQLFAPETRNQSRGCFDGSTITRIAIVLWLERILGSKH